MGTSRDTERGHRRRECHRVSQLPGCSFFCIFCPCLFSNKSNHPNSGNFFSSQRKWELRLFLVLHRAALALSSTGRERRGTGMLIKWNPFLIVYKYFTCFLFLFHIFIWPLKIFSSPAVAATSIPKPWKQVQAFTVNVNTVQQLFQCPSINCGYYSTALGEHTERRDCSVEKTFPGRLAVWETGETHNYFIFTPFCFTLFYYNRQTCF